MNDFQIPTDRDLPRGQLERRTSHLVRELARTIRRRRLALSLVPAVAVLLTAATGFTAYTLLRSEPSHFESIGCYDRASLDANVTVVSSDGSGPIAQCRRLWVKGDVGSPVPTRLAACVLKTGPIGVFPSSGAQTCARLGLADVSAAALQESKRFARLQDAIIARIGVPPSGSTRGTGCVGEERAQVIVRHELVVHGYGDWKILTAGGVFTPERPCAEVSFDTGAKTVFLIPGLRK